MNLPALSAAIVSAILNSRGDSNHNLATTVQNMIAEAVKHRNPSDPEMRWDDELGCEDTLDGKARLYALEVFREYRTALENADRADLEALAILLIQKRAVDGLNGRRCAHLYFEDAVTSILEKVKIKP